MELFPYILSRVAALNSSHLSHFQLDYHQQWERLHHLKQQHLQQKTDFIDQLNLFASESSHYQLKAYLRNLIRDIYNERKVKFSKIEALVLSREEQIALASWKKQLTSLTDLRQQIEKTKTDFNHFYAEQLSDMRVALKELLQHDALQNGLLMASHSTLDRLQGYLQKSKLRKKERQSEITFWKYLSRIICKTSPFSSFTNLSVVGNTEAITHFSQLRLNNLILAYLQELLQKEESFYPYLHLRLNPSIQVLENDFFFILNTRNVESIQEMERTDLLDFFYELLSNKPELNTFEILVQELLVPLEADVEELKLFILQLISYGFLEWDWKISGTDPNYLERFLDKLAGMQDVPVAVELHEILRRIQSAIERYPQANLLERKNIQNTAFRELEAFSRQLSAKLIPEEQASTEAFQQFKIADFFFKKEQLFYEDTSTITQALFDQAALQNLIAPLKKLLKATSSLFDAKMKKAVVAFFKENYSTGETVSILEFYRAFYTKHSLQKLSGNEIKEMSDGAWESFLAQHILETADGSIQINATHLEPDETHQTPMGALLQIYKEQGQLMAVVNASFTGFHKYFSRFFSLFPPTILKEARSWNQHIFENLVLVENRDASYFNANVHPPLVDYELSMQGSHQNLPKEKQISISDLILKADENNQPVLLQKSNSKKLCVIDFGFEAIENRSAMYQLLRSFSPISYSHLPLIDLLNQQFVKKEENGIIIYPQISLDEAIILQRKSWRIPKVNFPNFPQKDQATDFLALNNWRVTMQLPEKVFAKIIENRGEAVHAKEANHKPQYIDFSNPFLVNLFIKMIQQSREYLMLETTVPLPEQALALKENRYCMEFLLEWK